MLQFIDGRCAVGPASAGAVPGPAAYGRGGPLAVTDVHVLLGRLRPEYLPSVFGPARRRAARCRDRVGTLCRARGRDVGGNRPAALGRGGGRGLPDGRGRHDGERDPARQPRRAATIRPSSRWRASAARAASTPAAWPRRSASARSSSIASPACCRRSASASPSRARCAAARCASGSTRPGWPPRCGSPTSSRARARDGLEGARRDASRGTRRDSRRRLGRRAAGRVRTAGGDGGRVRRRARAGASAIDPPGRGSHRRGQRRAGRPPPDADLPAPRAVARAGHAPGRDVDRLVRRRGGSAVPLSPARGARRRRPHRGPGHRRRGHRDHDRRTAAGARGDPAGAAAGAAARRPRARRAGRRGPRRPGADRGVRRPVHARRRADGHRAAAGGSSVNIRERLDYSCALFDAGGRLVANAPHMPVHLGSMGASVRAVCATGTARRSARATRSWSTRPYAGGTHLPGPHGRRRRSTSTARPSADFLGRLARAPRRRRRHHAGLDAAVQPQHRRGRRAVRGRARSSAAARSTRRWCAGCSAAGPGRRATSPATSPTSPRSSPPTRAAPPSSRGWCASTASAWSRAYMAPRAAQRRGARARGAARAAARRAGPKRHERELDGGERLCVTLTVDGEHGSARVDFTGTSPQSHQQLQRAARGVHRGRAVRVPHAGRRRHPAQRGLPRAARARDPARARCSTRARRRGRRRQRRDLAGDRRPAVRRARRAGRLAGHDEQLHLRRRRLPVLRDDRRRRRRRPRLRRRERRADPHDELAAHRPGGARVAPAGAAARVPLSARFGRRRSLARRRRAGAPDRVPSPARGRDPRQQPP